MKVKFNILCIIIVLLSIWGMTSPMIMSSTTNMYGEGKTEKDFFERMKSLNLSGPTEILQLWPKDADHWFADSIYNKKSGKVEPMQIFSAQVHSSVVKNADSNDGFYAMLRGFSLGLIMMVFTVLFISIIISVNRGRIFTRSLENRLSICGCLLIAEYLLRHIYAYYQAGKLAELYDFENYSLSDYSDPMVTFFAIGGVGLLLMAQIFAIARKMKEEQDLTI